MECAADEDKNRITSAMELGVTQLFVSASGIAVRLAFVSIVLGNIAFTVVLEFDSSLASDSVNLCMLDLDAA